MRKYHLFTIRALSNIHVGSGDANFGVVDKLVQRDPASGYPYISSSSLKGALREHCEELGAEFTDYIFGAEAKDNKESKSGVYKFFSAYLLSIPARSDIRPYFNATSNNIFKLFEENLSAFNISPKYDFPSEKSGDDKVKIFSDGSGTIEDYKVEKSKFQISDEIKQLLGDFPAIFDDKIFINEISTNLPVIARNNLENGISKNLWYEEVCPRETRFFFIIGVPEGDKEFEKFKGSIIEMPVQIGANASIGYGFCKIEYIGG